MARGIPRPGGRLKQFFLESSSAYDLCIAGLAMLSSLISAQKFFDDHKDGIGYAMWAITAAVFLVTVAKVVVPFFVKEIAQRPHDLEASLHALCAVLLMGKMEDAGSDVGLRLTIHIPIDGGQRLQQIVEYVGDRRGGETNGRTFPAQSGIIGKVLREKKACVMRRKNDNHQAYVRELMTEWGYTEADARKRDPATMAWMAVPLVEEHKNRVEGVVYLDAVDRDFFTDDRKILALYACVGIANYVGLTVEFNSPNLSAPGPPTNPTA